MTVNRSTSSSQSDEKSTQFEKGCEELSDMKNIKYSDNQVKENSWKPNGETQKRSGDMVMKSHFVSVPLSRACLNDVKEVQATLSKEAKQLNFRQTGLDSFQLTLGVFKIDKSRKDKTEKELTESVNKILKDFLDKRPPVELTFGDLGSFGSQIVFIHVTNVKQLESLRQEMNDCLKTEGIYIADERFTPHVTLFRASRRNGGRHRNRSGSESKLTVQDMVNRTDLPPVTSSPVNEIIFQKLRGY